MTERAGRFLAHARAAMAIAFAVVPAVVPAFGAGDFLAGMEDVPLMDGLREDPDSGIVFDKPSGRIVEATAEGDATPGDIAAFYRTTLPELGWTPVAAQTGSTLRFRRNDECLTIRIEDGPAAAAAYFSLAPARTME